MVFLIKQMEDLWYFLLRNGAAVVFLIKQIEDLWYFLLRNGAAVVFLIKQIKDLWFLIQNGAAVVFLIKEWRIRRGGGKAILNRLTIRKCSSCGISY